MLPIAPLMIEHRLIERMIAVLRDEVTRMERARKADPVMIDSAVDFIRTYADRTHHGKEEDILFRALKGKSLSAPHRKAMDELVQDHVFGRRLTGELVAANDRYRQGERAALSDILDRLIRLADFYPKHIEKEDRRFFRPVMEYFTNAEQEEMLRKFHDFDRKMIHERYGLYVERLEKERSLAARTGADWLDYL